MPTYEYECPDCGAKKTRPLCRPEDRDDLPICPGAWDVEPHSIPMRRIVSQISSYIGSKDRPRRGQG